MQVNLKEISIFAFSYDFDILFWNCSDSVVCFFPSFYSYIATLFKVRFIQDFALFRVRFRQVSLYNKDACSICRLPNAFNKYNS